MHSKPFIATSGTQYMAVPLPRHDSFTVGKGRWTAVVDDDTPGHRDTFRWHGFHTREDAEEFLNTKTAGIAVNPVKRVYEMERPL